MAEIRGARKSGEAFKEGDFEAAAFHKYMQVKEGHNFREATEALKKIDTIVRYLKKFNTKAGRKGLEIEGLDQIFIDAGFEWREPGCSMCLGMNADRLEPGERCASTSNRHFEGRQGQGGRTQLVSPAMAAAAAISGHVVDVRKL